jgi:hypothetical protein
VKLGEWRELFSHRYKQYIDELTELGMETAQDAFDSAPAEYGNGEVNVTREFDGTTNCTIRAVGEDAMFIEFGTGVETIATRQTVQSEVPIEVGSWSDENHGEFARTGYKYWHYGGTAIAGTPPMGGMQEACAQMQNWSSTIARRAFG